MVLQDTCYSDDASADGLHGALSPSRGRARKNEISRCVLPLPRGRHSQHDQKAQTLLFEHESAIAVTHADALDCAEPLA